LTESEDITISSTYMKYKGREKSNVSRTLSSKSRIRSEMIGEKGEPMRILKFCLYMTPSKRKYVESKINFKSFRNSFRGIEQLAMCPHLFKILSIAKSNAIFVKRDITSSEIRI